MTGLFLVRAMSLQCGFVTPRAWGWAVIQGMGSRGAQLMVGVLLGSGTFLLSRWMVHQLCVSSSQYSRKELLS